MDRLSQLRGEAGSSRDSTLDTSSPPSEAFMTANESSSKYFSLSEVDSTFDISPIKDVSLTSASMESEKTVTESDQLISNLSPIGKKDFMDGYKIGKQIEAANILSGGVDIFDDNDNSYDGDELVIDDNADIDEKSNPDLKIADSSEATLMETDVVPSKDIEVILQIDGKNVDAIDIGNGLYLYRKQGQEELAAVQIIDDDQHQPSFKFLKVRENAEGNLEVYEEIQIEVPNEVPMKEEKVVNKSVSHVPIKDINKVISDSTSNKIAERKTKTQNVTPTVTVAKEPVIETSKEVQVESKSEASKKIKFSESRKSPVIGSFTPMTFHSTPNKEGIPLTKTMVDQQLHPSRHSDNIKKTIEVHTDSAKQRSLDASGKPKDAITDDKNKPVLADKEISVEKNTTELGLDNKNLAKDVVEAEIKKDNKIVEEPQLITKEREEILNDEKELTSVENSKLESPDLDNASHDKKSLESPVAECREFTLNKSKSQEENKMDIVEEVTISSADKKLTEDTIHTKSPVEETVHKKCELAKENEESIADKVVNEEHCILEKKNTGTDKNDTEVVDSNTDDSLKREDRNKIVVDNQPKAYDDVDSKTCTDNIAKQIHEKNKNTTNVTSIQDSDVKKKDSKVELEVKSDNIGKKTEPQVEERTENVLPTTTPIETVPKQSKAEPIEQKFNKPDKSEQLKVTPVIKMVSEKDCEKLPLLQKQSDTIQPDKDSKNSNAMSNFKSDSLISASGETSNAEQKVQPITVVPNNTLAGLKSDLPVSTSHQTSKVEPKVQSKTITNDSKLTDLKSDMPVPSETCKIEPKAQPITITNERKEIKIQDVKHVPAQNIPPSKNDSADKKPLPKIVSTTDSKPINNNHAAVPFGKWTEANRQAFLNRIKESKVPTNSSNGKQIKNSNDLNRRDVLKKIDSQRQSSIATAKAHELKIENQRLSEQPQDFGSATRMGVKKEAALANKQPASHESRLAVKTEPPILKNITMPAKKTKQETVVKPQNETVTSSATDVKKESKQRKEINNQDLIDKTIEEIINRPVPAKTPQEVQAQRCYDEIEMKMNELHGKPFVERPIHELPPAQKISPKTYPKSEYLKPTASKPSKIPNLLPFNKSQQKAVKDNTTDIDSEEEVIIEHEPITGDMDLDKKKSTKLVVTEKLPIPETITQPTVDSSKKEAIITEKDFDKFARRNSISYENCLTVNFDGKEPHNVIQSVVQKDLPLKTYSKLEATTQHNAKVMSPRKRELFNPNSHPKTAPNTKYGATIIEDDGKNYQSKVKIAYQTAMTAKRHLERPITIIEDRPVKVVYMDTNTEFVSNQLNVQGKELSPAKKTLPSAVSVTTITTDSQDSDNTLDSIDEEKMIEDIKIKTKHQRKQVLTPVETPELELIEPNDLGIEVSPKKKRKTEEKVEKNTKSLVPKKTYLYGRGNALEDSPPKSFDFNKTSQRDTLNQDISHVSHKNTASAIDSLVKAAELLETQSGNIPTKAPDTPTSDSQQNTPVKRGRGRPRKYPLPEGTPDKTKVPSPQKKPRLIDAKVDKSKDTDEDYSTDDDAMIKENWTMGKINENIVCPICKKLFRSENVVFKHVKHCTGPSPSRSDSENKSPRRFRESQESESRSYGSKSDDMEIEESEPSPKDGRMKRKSKDTLQKSAEKDDIIIIEDTPLKAKPNKEEKEKRDEAKPTESKKTAIKSNLPDKVSSLVCEFCGKTFRQLSYLVSHKLQHEKDDAKKTETEPAKPTTTIFSCEVCKKEFRKLHHLVQHRIIHNPSTVSAKTSRKSSSEQNDNKVSKEPSTSKSSEESNAAFRCEPCDKSFRKLHHLVEHRETHDGINRQRNILPVQANAEKPAPPPQCEICKKTFRKMHHLIEHKEQHVETSSEKSDDKSIKSALSTKDIIHECSLCYMVFPNEQALNKHMIICQRKKRQSANKQIKQSEKNEIIEEDKEAVKVDENNVENVDDDVTIVTDEVVAEEPMREIIKEVVEDQTESKMEIVEEPVKPTTPPLVLSESLKPNNETEKKEDDKPIEPIISIPPTRKVSSDLPIKVKKSDNKELKPKVHDTTRKKTPLKDKTGPTVTKRHKPNVPLPVVETKVIKPAESSDDDEARYMLNPDYKFDNNEEKLFTKVRANKRNSLQIERPNSKDLVKRRISLQHPIKVPRLKAKAIQNNKIAPIPTTSSKTVVKAPKPEPASSTDSDDSDVKYSFPKNAPDEVTKSNHPETPTKEPVKKTQRKSMAEKRKSLSSIAKRKSLGKAVGAKHKVKPSPVKQVRKRTAEVEHRCDCGQLFSSAALLSRHTTLAHTPPRIRRRRSPPPDLNTKTITKPAPRKSTLPAPKTRPSADPRKSSIKSDASIPAAKVTQPTKRKSTAKTEPKTPNETRKSPKSSEKTDVKSAPTNVKLRRYAAHKGVPVPEKMRKLMEKSKK